MNYKAPGYIEQYNKRLKEWCDWEVELATAQHDSSDFLRVYRVQKNRTRHRQRVFIGCLPAETPVGVLMCVTSLCRHYFSWGKMWNDPAISNLQ